MTTVNLQAFKAIKQEQINAQTKVPDHSFDWNIYQGRLDLLSRVESLFEETILVSPTPVEPVKTAKKAAPVAVPVEAEPVEGKE